MWICSDFSRHRDHQCSSSLPFFEMIQQALKARSKRSQFLLFWGKRGSGCEKSGSEEFLDFFLFEIYIYIMI